MEKEWKGHKETDGERQKERETEGERETEEEKERDPWQDISGAPLSLSAWEWRYMMIFNLQIRLPLPDSADSSVFLQMMTLQKNFLHWVMSINVEHELPDLSFSTVMIRFVY